jgi:methyl-accepting chemotaxis protein
MEKSIKMLVWIRVAVIFFAIVISGIVSFAGLSITRQISTDTAEATNVHTLALSAEKAHFNWIENLSSAISFGTEFTGSTDCTTCDLGRWLYNTDRSTVSSELSSLMDQIMPLHQAIHDSATEILALNATDPVQAQDMYLNQTKKNVNSLVKLLEQVVTISEEKVLNSETLLHNTINITMLVTIATVVVIIIACLLLLRYVMAGIVRPIQAITENSQKLSQGKLDFEIHVDNRDEIGLLAQSLNQAAKTLSLYISDISENLNAISQGNLNRVPQLDYIGDFVEIRKSTDVILKQLNDTMTQIQLVAVQVGNGAEHVSSGAQALAQGATEQANEVDSLVERVDQVSDQINTNAKTANETSIQIDQVEQQITRCNQQMEEMSHAMNEISSCSNEIGHIIKAIEDIAFQTNILALNAAVEAARAGSAGKGFAVVADEVRNLAAKSADAVKETTELIDKTLRMVESGSKLTDVTQESLHSVVAGAGTVTSQIKLISDASQEQEVAINHIKDSICQISTVIQSNSATSEESAAASEELSNQARILMNLVKQFKIKEK